MSDVKHNFSYLLMNVCFTRAFISIEKVEESRCSIVAAM